MNTTPTTTTDTGATSRRAHRKTERIKAQTAALRELHATQRATGLSVDTLDTSRDTSRMSTGERVATWITALFVLAVTAVACVVIVGTQTAFYASTLADHRHVDLFSLVTLDLAVFTPVAVEGIVWACTLMAVVLVMLNRPAGPWTRAMWLFATIAALVNTVHAAQLGDPVGALVKGGLSLAAPFVTHLFIHWVRHLRTGRTLDEHRELTGNRWIRVARVALTVVRTVATHVLHPRIATRALSIFLGTRVLTYTQAWHLAAAPYRRRLRRRLAKQQTTPPDTTTPEPRDVEPDHAVDTEPDDTADDARDATQPDATYAATDTADDASDDTQVQCDEITSHPDEQWCHIDVPGLGSQVADDNHTAELFARLEREMRPPASSAHERSPASAHDGEHSSDHPGEQCSHPPGEQCSPQCSRALTGERSPHASTHTRAECSHPLTCDEHRSPTGEHPDERSASTDVNTPMSTREHPGEHSASTPASTREHPGEHSVSTPVNAREQHRRAPSEHPGEQSASTTTSTGEHTPTAAEQVVDRYWQMHHSGHDLATVNKATLADEMGLTASTVRRVWSQCAKGQHPDPYL